MTAFDRIEPMLPDLLDELAPAHLPDYVNDMLRQTARTRQRPRWSSLERWLPMGVIARSAQVRQVPLRPIALTVILVVLATVALALFAGSRPHRIPPPFGPADNGAILYSTADGDIGVIGASGQGSRVLIGGGDHDWGPIVSPDGQRVAFARSVGGQESLWVANIDGSAARQVMATGSADDWIQWSPSSDRLLVVPSDTGMPVIVNASDGTSVPLTVPVPVNEATWRPGTDEIVVTSNDGHASVFGLMNADGSGYRVIPTAADAINGPALSPDGTRLAYTTWGTAAGEQGRIHVTTIDGGDDVLLTPTVIGGYIWLNPTFSPDGRSLAVVRYHGSDPVRLQVAILPVDGSAAPRPIGQEHDNGKDGVSAPFSPDGTQILATYSDDGTTWLVPVSGEPGKLLLSAGTSLDWQRMAH